MGNAKRVNNRKVINLILGVFVLDAEVMDNPYQEKEKRKEYASGENLCVLSVFF
jgi:hypothetical protein